MTAGNPFLTIEDHNNGDIISNWTSSQDIRDNIENCDENSRRSISTTVDEIIKLDSPGTDDPEPSKQLYKFEECVAVFKTGSGLLYHTRSKHEGIVYSCEQCRYKATTQSNLKVHQQYKHEGVKYSCNQCN